MTYQRKLWKAFLFLKVISLRKKKYIYLGWFMVILPEAGHKLL